MEKGVDAREMCRYLQQHDEEEDGGVQRLAQPRGEVNVDAVAESCQDESNGSVSVSLHDG